MINKTKILEQYHSALEHTFLWTVDSENAHLVESCMIECGWAAFNTIKIVQLGRCQNVIEACRDWVLLHNDIVKQKLHTRNNTKAIGLKCCRLHSSKAEQLEKASSQMLFS